MKSLWIYEPNQILAKGRYEEGNLHRLSICEGIEEMVAKSKESSKKENEYRS